MSLAATSRLGRVYPGLSARERAILVLGSLKNGTPEDPAWRRTMPQDQVKEFNRLIGLMNATNMYLPLYITMVEGQAEQMRLRINWWLTLTKYGSALWRLGAFVPDAKRKQAEQAMEDFFPIVELPWDHEQHERSWLNVSDQMTESVREAVAHLWDELNAIDVVLAEVAAEFDGEDALRSVMRGVLEKARYELSILHEFLSGKEAVENTVPCEESMDLARTYFNKGVDLYERL